MVDYKHFAQVRRIKQLFMSMIFVLVLIGGWFYPFLGYFIPLCMVLGLGIAVSRGRKWCDWYCPRGSFLDYAMSRFSPKKEIPGVLKNFRLRIGVLSVLMIIMLAQIILRWPDPYKIGKFFVTMLTVTTLLGVILALVYHQRSWCFICPIGSMSNWVGRKKHVLKINSSDCVECKLCTKVCPMQIRPYSYKKEGEQLILDGDCLKCASCVSACPKKALSL